jgi:CRP-like cAMP-binding protein
LQGSTQTRIVRKGDLGEELFVILKGIAEARITADGHSKLLGTMGSGDVFGEMSVFTRLPRSADVIAQTDLELIYFDRSMLEKLLVSNPQIGGRVLLNLCRVLSERFQARESCL